MENAQWNVTGTDLRYINLCLTFYSSDHILKSLKYIKIEIGTMNTRRFCYPQYVLALCHICSLHMSGNYWAFYEQYGNDSAAASIYFIPKYFTMNLKNKSIILYYHYHLSSKCPQWF